ncbi:MAG TPA: hypothetical protein VKQ36_09195, partial [Ktedonobacterales bacterium]|nr:hypothetical protein [Ktedonobacterales bacterium]
GRMIMDYALDWQRSQGVRAVYLDATLAGRPLYNALGFVSLGVYSWYVQTPVEKHNRAVLLARGGNLRASVAEVDALTQLSTLDVAAYGANRLGLLASLLAHPDTRLITVDDAAGQPAGYLVVCLTSRDGSLTYTGVRIGPWVATSDQAAASLLLRALEQADDWRSRIAGAPYVLVALPETNPAALDLLRAAGCQPERDDLLMRLDLAAGKKGELAPPGLAGNPALVYAWMASMTF